jgi:hypothetical protein
VESKWKNYHITTFPGQSLSKTLEEAMDLSQDRPILESGDAGKASIAKKKKNLVVSSRGLAVIRQS